MPSIKSALFLATMTLAGTSAVAAVPTAKQFVMKAGASDLFERKEATLMESSANADVSGFAKQMMTDHTKSTTMVKSAAMKDGLKPGAPMLTAKQKSDLAALMAAKGSDRDSLYITQQKAAHAEALDLMQGYSTDGTATHLKMTAGKIAPVVQSHIDMLDKMAM
jgi:putative membrane protein